MKSKLNLLAPVIFMLGLIVTVPSQAQAVSGSVPSPVRELVLDILKQAGIGSAHIISRRRSTRQEAAFLYRLLQGAGNEHAAVRNRYGPAGKRVIDVYLAHQTKPHATVLALMEVVINKQIALLGDNRREFMYVGPSRFHKFVVAIKLAHDLSQLEAALQDHPDIARLAGHGHGAGEPGVAYHLEIPKTLKTFSGLWRGRCRKTLAGGETIKYRHVMNLKRTVAGYSGTRKSPSLDGERWITSSLEDLAIDRRTKKIAYVYKGERGERIAIAGKFNDDYNRITYEKNSSKAKCNIRKRL